MNLKPAIKWINVQLETITDTPMQQSTAEPSLVEKNGT